MAKAMTRSSATVTGMLMATVRRMMRVTGTLTESATRMPMAMLTPMATARARGRPIVMTRARVMAIPMQMDSPRPMPTLTSA